MSLGRTPCGRDGRAPRGTRRERATIVHGGTAIVLLALCIPAYAEDDQPYLPRDTFGEVGILDMPTARMADDGEVSFTGATLGTGQQRLNFAFQVLPWLDGSFRYAHLSHFGTTGNYFDRSFGMKLRFWQETSLLPEFSMGIRDLIGTGVYGSEYFVASKHIWDIDASLGVGWGRLADDATFPNPFGYVFPSFKVRPPFTGPGGQVDFGEFFHGPHMGLFGGAIWPTPVQDLDLLVEYSSDRYKREVAGGAMSWREPVNVGLSYRPVGDVFVSAGWMYGTTWTASLTFAIDPKHPLSDVRIGAPPIPATIRTPKQQEGALDNVVGDEDKPKENQNLSALNQMLMSETPAVRDLELDGHTLLLNVSLPQGANVPCGLYTKVATRADAGVQSLAVTNLNDPGGKVTMCEAKTAPRIRVAEARTPGVIDASAAPSRLAPDVGQKIRDDARAQGIRIEALAVGDTTVSVYYRNARYFSEARGVGRLARILMLYMPPGVEIFSLTIVDHGVPQRTFTLTRSALERAAPFIASPSELGDAVEISRPGMDNPILDSALSQTYPRFFWSIAPGFRQSVFDPNAPYQVQFYAAGVLGVDILPGLTASTKLDGNIWNNFDTTRVSTSVLPHVRSDINEYYKFGSSGVETLTLTYRTRLAPDVFAEATAGYLEQMFAGVGGQVLWRPEDSRIALGGDLYAVQQRGFDELLNLRNYRTITGHLTVYYNSPFYDLNFQVHVGRYLAGDYGGTFEISRRFDTGIEIGAFATFTNVPFNKFGEGSFDKGIVVHVPLEWGLPIYSTTVEDLTLKSLSRDGGQRLANDDSLYEETERTSYGEIETHIDDVTNP